MKTIVFLVLFGSFVVFLAALLVLKFSKKEWAKRAYIIVKRICTTVFIFCLLLSFIITSAYFDFICCDSGWVLLLLSLLGLFLALLVALLVLKFSKKERTKKAYIIVKRICTTVFMLFLLLLALKAYWIINPQTCACGTSGFTLESGDKSAYF